MARGSDPQTCRSVRPARWRPARRGSAPCRIVPGSVRAAQKGMRQRRAASGIGRGNSFPPFHGAISGSFHSTACPLDRARGISDQLRSSTPVPQVDFPKWVSPSWFMQNRFTQSQVTRVALQNALALVERVSVKVRLKVRKTPHSGSLKNTTKSCRDCGTNRPFPQLRGRCDTGESSQIRYLNT